MLTFPLLDTRINLSSNSAELEEFLSDLVAEPRQNQEIRNSFQVEILQIGRSLLYRENGVDLLCSRHLEWLTVFAHQRINRQVVDRYKGVLLVHAGCGTLQGKRFLLAGSRGTGKTTLMTRLLFEGAESHADDLVLLQGRSVTPFPRKFHIKTGTLELIPQLQSQSTKGRLYPTRTSRFFFFDPRQAGRPWSCLPAEVDAVIHLRTRRSGRSRLSECPKFLMAGELLRHLQNYSDHNRHRLPDLYQMVNQAACFELEMGDLEHAVEELCIALR